MKYIKLLFAYLFFIFGFTSLLGFFRYSVSSSGEDMIFMVVFTIIGFGIGSLLIKSYRKSKKGEVK